MLQEAGSNLYPVLEMWRLHLTPADKYRLKRGTGSVGTDHKRQGGLVTKAPKSRYQRHVDSHHTFGTEPS